MAGMSTLDALLRQDFTAFIEKVFRTVEQSGDYRHNWHIEAMAHALKAHGADKGGRLIITQPPRSLKSICASVAYPAWALGHNPALKFVCVSYSSDLALKLARQFRMVVTSDWYQRAFPGMRIARDTGQETVSTKGGFRYATSVGGTLRGEGADVIIIDDPQKGGEDNSKAERDHVAEWYRTSLVSRHNTPETGSIILVMQRLHEEDLAGHLLEQGGWHHLNLPAVAPADDIIPIGPGRMHYFAKGELLHPDHLTREVLDERRRVMGSRAFSAQYLQQPVPAEGNIVKRAWLERRYETPPQSQEGRTIVQSWDPASSLGEQSAYSVGLTFLVDGKTYYLLDVERRKLEYPDLRQRVIELAGRYGAATVLIEKAGLGTHLVQDLRRDATPGMPPPTGIVPEGDKATRMEAQAAKIENGQLVLPEDAPWLADFEHELLAFPNSRTMDQVDGLSQFLKWAGTRENDRYVPWVPETVWGDDGWRY